MREHPVEVARRALREAALIEPDADWAGRMRRLADVLPQRESVATETLPDNVRSLDAVR